MEKKSSLVSHAEREMEVLLKLHPDKNDPPILEFYRQEILAFVKRFSEAGHSAGSASAVSSALSQSLHKLFLQQSIAPLTGLPDEFREVSDGVYQNIRDSRVFKEREYDMKPTFLDAVIWTNAINKQATHGSAMLGETRVRSKALIKQFPFQPVTFLSAALRYPIQIARMSSG